MADRYEIADEMLTAAGLRWYELCSWAAKEDSRCRHNLGYWRGDDWWGAGPGAHSHVGGRRWWNERLPSRWMAALADGRSPTAGSERPDEREAALERVMLGLRMSEGLSLEQLDGPARAEAEAAAHEGLLEVHGDRAVLTRTGRLLADAVIRRLTPDPA
jgi:oxygen-independent coproporphyrinogen-3 oxidase